MKKIKISSMSIKTLNESIRKCIINDTIIDNTPPIIEADGSFSSILNTKDNFDKNTLADTIKIDDTLEEPSKETQTLIDKATDSIKKTLEASDELKNILNKLKKQKKADISEWKVNEEGNTAYLKNKDIYIFKQNDNLCLSHMGKIELFDTVPELHEWLKKNKYPLPKNIQLHENTKRSWMDLVNNNKTVWVLRNKNNNKFISNTYKDFNSTIPLTKESGDALLFTKDYKIKEFYNSLPNSIKNDFVIENIPFNNIKSDIENVNILDNAKLGYFPNDLYKKVMKFLDKENDIKIKNFNTEESSSKKECGVGATTTTSLGAPIQYTGKKMKKESIILAEKILGYPDTPFSSRLYNRPYDRASEYIGYAKEMIEQGKPELIDDKLYQQAQDEYRSYVLLDRGSKAWAALFTGVNIGNPKEYKKVIDELNTKYNIHATAEEPPFNNPKIGIKIGDTNKKARKEWITTYWLPEQSNKIQSTKIRRVTNKRDEYNQNLPIQGKEKTKLDKILNQLIKKHDKISPMEFFSELNDLKKNTTKKEFIYILDNLKKAAEEKVINPEEIAIKTWNILSESTNQSNSLLNKYPWLNKLLETSLKEDDSPADFAKGEPLEKNISSNDDIDINSDNNSTEDSLEDFELDNTTDNTDFSSDIDFSDINSNYSLDSDNDENDNVENNIPEEEYEILDIMTNNIDPTDIKVKLKNINTNKTEIVDISEIDIL